MKTKQTKEAAREAASAAWWLVTDTPYYSLTDIEQKAWERALRKGLRDVEKAKLQREN